VILGAVLFFAYKMYKVARAPVDLIQGVGERTRSFFQRVGDRFSEARTGLSERLGNKPKTQDELNPEVRTSYTAEWKRQGGVMGTVGSVLEPFESAVSGLFESGKSPQIHKTPLAYEEYKKQKKEEKPDIFTDRQETAKYGMAPVAGIRGEQRTQQGTGRVREGLINFNGFLNQKINESLQI